MCAFYPANVSSYVIEKKMMCVVGGDEKEFSPSLLLYKSLELYTYVCVCVVGGCWSAGGRIVFSFFFFSNGGLTSSLLIIRS